MRQTRLPIEAQDVVVPGDVEEAYSFAKEMARIEVEENLKKEYKSGFWASIVNILAQRLRKDEDETKHKSKCLDTQDRGNNSN